jgi:hypothetical protein
LESNFETYFEEIFLFFWPGKTNYDPEYLLGNFWETIRRDAV